MAFPCPHCGENMITRSSLMISQLTRESYYQCSNAHCGHTAKGVTELMRSIVAPNFPNPKCTLPLIKPEDPRPPHRDESTQLELL